MTSRNDLQLVFTDRNPSGVVKTRRWLLVILAICALTPSSVCGVEYRLDAIVTQRYPNVIDSYFFDINNHGQSTGYIRTGDLNDYQAVIFKDGVFESLPVPQRNNGATIWFRQNAGYDINDAGQVVGPFVDPQRPATIGPGTLAQTVGWLTPTGPKSLAAWNGRTAPASIVGDGVFNFNSQTEEHDGGNPIALNDLGQLVEDRGDRVIFHDKETVRELQFLSPLYAPIEGSDVSTSGLTSLNNQGMFTIQKGIFTELIPENPDDLPQVRLEYTTYVIDIHAESLHPLSVPDQYDAVVALDIDENGIVFGHAHTWIRDEIGFGYVQDPHYLTWNADGSIRELIPMPAGEVRSMRRNSLGQVVASVDGQPQLFLDGAWKPINFVGDAPSSLSIFELNNLGQFIGLMDVGVGTRAYVATPVVPEPNSYGLMATSLVGLLLVRTQIRSHDGNLDGDSHS